MITTLYLLVILVALCLGVIGSIIVAIIDKRCDKSIQEQAGVQKQIARLEGEGQERNKLIEQLETEIRQASPKRNPYKTNAGLEDAIAVSIELIREYKDTQEYTAQRIKQLQEILKTVRNEPGNYDEDRPSGRRRPIRDD